MIQIRFTQEVEEVKTPLASSNGKYIKCQVCVVTLLLVQLLSGAPAIPRNRAWNSDRHCEMRRTVCFWRKTIQPTTRTVSYNFFVKFFTLTFTVGHRRTYVLPVTDLVVFCFLPYLSIVIIYTFRFSFETVRSPTRLLSL